MTREEYHELSQREQQAIINRWRQDVKDLEEKGWVRFETWLAKYKGE